MTDLALIQTVLGLASTAVELTGQASKTVTSIKSIFKEESGGRNSEAQALLNRLLEDLASANLMNAKLSTTLKALVSELDNSRRFEERAARYRLFQTQEGAMLYELGPETAGNELHHYICPRCLENDQKFHIVSGSNGSEGKHCQNCNLYFPFRSRPNPSRQIVGYF
ncbi:MAG: hypothetical protein V4747_13360 [Pseudomonadota bacterium]